MYLFLYMYIYLHIVVFVMSFYLFARELLYFTLRSFYSLAEGENPSKPITHI